MPQCVMKNLLQHAVSALATVLLLFSTTAEPAEPSNSTHMPELFTHNEEPRVLALQRPCGAQHESYCINGTCSYINDLTMPQCKCDPNFSGPRCEHFILNTVVHSQPEEIVGITCGVLLLLVCIACLLCFSYKRRCWRSLPLKKGQENSVETLQV
ncbi:epigen [Astyanax mexicanus]|uniref:Epigen n=1 Tax=Astyanax mexicanus TaxID=7994 RepID=A0A8T2LGE4_ASTMX|nr:epigen [Astyanax mexicanus]KAG9270610.1 epigen [Astyanax mexicanus]